MSNTPINYTLGKDFITFSGISTDVSYYLQSYDGLGFDAGSTQTSSPYGPIYQPGDVIIYNQFSATFIIDEGWEVYQTISEMAIKNAPLDGSSYEPTLTDITLHLMNNTYQKEVAQIVMYYGYISNIMNVQNNYSTNDNTIPPKTMNVLIKYQYSKFFRIEDQ